MKFWRQIQENQLEQIEIDTERDNYMSAEEAKAYGLIDNVITNR